MATVRAGFGRAAAAAAEERSYARATAADEAAVSDGSSSMELTDTEDAVSAAKTEDRRLATAPAAAPAAATTSAVSHRFESSSHRKKKRSSSSSSAAAAGGGSTRRRSSSSSSAAAAADYSGEGTDSSIENHHHQAAAAAASGVGAARREGREEAAAEMRHKEEEERREALKRRQQRQKKRRRSSEWREQQQQQYQSFARSEMAVKEKSTETAASGEQQQQQRPSSREARRREKEEEKQQQESAVGKETTRQTKKKRKHHSSSSRNSEETVERNKETTQSSSSSSSSTSFSSLPPPWRRSSNRGNSAGDAASCCTNLLKNSSSSSSKSSELQENSGSVQRRSSSSSDSSMSYSSRDSSRERERCHDDDAREIDRRRRSSRSRCSSRSKCSSSDSSSRSDAETPHPRESVGARSSSSSSSRRNSSEHRSSSSSRKRYSAGHRKRKRRSSSREQPQQQPEAAASTAADLEMQLLALQQEIAEANMQRIQKQEEALKAFLAQPDSSGPPPCGAVHLRRNEDSASSKAEGLSGNEGDSEEEEEEEEYNADDLVGERIEAMQSQQVTLELVEKNKGTQTSCHRQQQQQQLPREVQSLEESEKCLHSSIISNLKRCGFKRLMPVQKFAFPIAAAGFDICGMAQTGSGKTLAFIAPLLSQLLRVGSVFRPFFPGSRAQASPLGLILVPTRELALQIGEEIERMTRQTELHHVVLAGGCTAKEQAALINRQQVDVAVCTPGRLEDLCDMCKVCLEFVQILVLDEADAMLDLGFRDKIVALVNDRDMPKERQTLLFSATYAEELMSLIPTFLRGTYVRLTVGSQTDGNVVSPGSATQGPAVKQILKLVGSDAKLATLLEDLERFLRMQKLATLAQKNASSIHTSAATASLGSTEISRQAAITAAAAAASAASAEVATASAAPLGACSSSAGASGVANTIVGLAGGSSTGAVTKTPLAPPQPTLCFQQQQVIVFVNSKRDVFPTVHALRLRGISVDGLSGSMSREARRQIYHDFKARRFQIMVATSLAARGLDFLDVSLVINYDVPTQVETYLHRIGRTGRLGRTGTAITYVCRKDRKVAPGLVKILKKAGETVPGFLELMARETGEADA